MKKKWLQDWLFKSSINMFKKRINYSKGIIDPKILDSNPLDLFLVWMKDAIDSDLIEEPNAMNISTIEDDGCPKSRIVLLKDFSKEGLTFFTNYNSSKGRSIKKNNKVGVSFFWGPLQRQIIMKGKAKKISSYLSEEYFYSRPRKSQIASIISPQSEVISDRDFLDDRMKKLENEYKDRTILMPDNWGGFIIKPFEIEFWQGRPDRLHDRICFKLRNNRWRSDRLAP
ncbi:MAG: pyridoxamine 5'-phosphate oxidase [Bacteroidota bacterium]|nr:pyridoxamine 5'-phosphate oxidase [Bacteroidota bacterium]